MKMQLEATPHRILKPQLEIRRCSQRIWLTYAVEVDVVGVIVTVTMVTVLVTVTTTCYFAKISLGLLDSEHRLLNLQKQRGLPRTKERRELT